MLLPEDPAMAVLGDKRDLNGNLPEVICEGARHDSPQEESPQDAEGKVEFVLLPIFWQVAERGIRTALRCI